MSSPYEPPGSKPESSYDLKESVQAIARAWRGHPERHPLPEELLGYHNRELSEPDEDRLREHLALCPQCAQAVLDFARFPAIEPIHADGLTKMETHARWHRLRGRLRGESRGVLTARLRQFTLWLRSRWNSPGLAWATAAATLLATLGLWLFAPRTTDRDGRGPRLNVMVAELAPQGENGERAGISEQKLTIPATAEAALLVLGYAGARSHSNYVVEIRKADAGPDSAPFWRSAKLKRAPEGVFRVELPREFLPEGRYVITIRAPGEDEWVASYTVAIEHEKRL